MIHPLLQNLDETERYLLAIYTLFDIEGPDATKVKNVMTKLTGKKFLDFKTCITELRSKGLINAGNYNWRTDTYDYSIEPMMLIACMTYFYEHDSELTIKVLNAGKSLIPSELQKMLWGYICSEYKDINLEELDDYDIGENIDVFMPVVCDQRFASLLHVFNNENFFELVDGYAALCLEHEIVTDCDYLRSFFKSYKGRDKDNMKERITCLIDLLDYLTNGKRPVTLLASNKNHRVIAAIHEAYHGNFDKAMDHFKKAVTLNNKSQSGYYTASKSYLPLSILNFYYVLTAYRAGTEEGRKKANAISKATNNDVTAPAKALYNIFYGGCTDKQLKDKLSALLSSKGQLDRNLALLMCKYIGQEVNIMYEPQWLAMRHEFRKYIPLSEEDEKKANAAYGKESLLTTIYRKQEWENVLEELMGTSLGGKSEKKDVRIGYFLHQINSKMVEIRQQSILKNGTWGAGKSVSLQAFLNGEVEGMTPADHRIAAAARGNIYYSYDFSLDFVLPEMVDHSRLYVGHYAPYTLVDVTEEMPYLNLTKTKSGFEVTSNIPLVDIDYKVIITHRGAASINFIRIADDKRPYYKKLLQLGHFPLEAEGQLRTFLQSIGGKIEVNSDLIEGGSTLPLAQGQPQLIMQMRPQDRDNYIVGVFCRPLEGGRIRCTPGMGNDIIVDGNDDGRTRVQRDLAKEEENYNHLLETTEIMDLMAFARNSSDNVADATFPVQSYDLLPILEYAQQNPDRISCEWPEGSRLKIRQRQSTTAWTGAIKKNENGWFEIEGTVELDQGKVVTMAQLLDLVGQSHGRFIKLGEGEFLALSDKLRKQLSQLDAIASRSHGKLQMSPFSAALLGADMLDGELILDEDEELKQIRQRIKESSTYSPHVPKTLNATLREYQKEGFRWMARLNKWGAGALLADDMGLGKTIQTITFLLSKAKEGPALVIAPASVAPNWKVEFEKFAPSLNIVMLNFEFNRGKAIREAKAGDVVVTTYGLLLSVKDDVTKKHWHTICLDEAHIIKNRGAKTSAVAMKLKSSNRVMLTGTPVQNHLGELWNLFQFVNPGLLGSFDDFNRRFIVPIEQNQDKERQKELDRLVKPFMLRRTKDKVAKELPDKQEIYQHVDLTEEEQLVYEAMRQKAEALLLAEQGGTVSMNTLAEITRLRQCACDIRLVEKDGNGNAFTTKSGDDGSKIKALIELLATISESDSHALVFSQFTSYLSLVKAALDREGIHYLYIDGTVPIKERQRLVEQFQDGNAPVFLISLKAGGLGLNLTRANYVIHMDPWWNPAIEAQATDRAHRIGQKQSVTVYHLIAEGTIEEKIQRLHERKQALVENILDSTDMSHKLTGEELLEMVR